MPKELLWTIYDAAKEFVEQVERLAPDCFTPEEQEMFLWNIDKYCISTIGRNIEKVCITKK